MRWLILSFATFVSVLEFICAVGNLQTQKNATKLPPCKACRTFVESFTKGLERTSKFKFEGGDTAWEEEKLGRYSTSEVRFVEIHERLCSDVEVGKEQCYELLEKYDDALEDWWFNKQKEEADLFSYLCVNIFSICCPDLHYGPECQPCFGYPDNVCYNNGKCKGAGSRKGNGKCICDQGYAGDYCEKCSDNYYESYKDDKKILCSECHIACEGPCTKAGPSGCSKCKSGWVMDSEKGCLDINECATARSVCTPLQFCVNNEGGYRCLDCDRACAGCTGDGPDMCIQCAAGYYKKDNICIDTSEDNRRNFVSYSRYFTYLGLCIATCVILNKNTYLAALVGSLVAIYITVAEYMLNTPPTPKGDIGNQVAEQVMRALN